MARPPNRQATRPPWPIWPASRNPAALRTPRRSRSCQRSMRAPYLQDVSVGPRFASVKIAAANHEGVLANRDGAFILNRVRGDLGFGPACRKRRRTALGSTLSVLLVASLAVATRSWAGADFSSLSCRSKSIPRFPPKASPSGRGLVRCTCAPRARGARREPASSAGRHGCQIAVTRWRSLNGAVAIICSDLMLSLASFSRAISNRERTLATLLSSTATRRWLTPIPR